MVPFVVRFCAISTHSKKQEPYEKSSVRHFVCRNPVKRASRPRAKSQLRRGTSLARHLLQTQTRPSGSVLERLSREPQARIRTGKEGRHAQGLQSLDQHNRQT